MVVLFFDKVINFEICIYVVFFIDFFGKIMGFFLLVKNKLNNMLNIYFRWIMFFVEILYCKFKMFENFMFWILNNF